MKSFFIYFVGVRNNFYLMLSFRGFEPAEFSKYNRISKS